MVHPVAYSLNDPLLESYAEQTFSETLTTIASQYGHRISFFVVQDHDDYKE